MDAQVKERIMALAGEIDDDQLRSIGAAYLRGRDREAWASLDAFQRSEYRKEAMFLHHCMGIVPKAAVGIVRRMVRIGAWK